MSREQQTPEVGPQEERVEEFIERASDFMARAQNEAKMYFVIEGGEKKITTSIEIAKQFDKESKKLRGELFPEVDDTDWQKIKEEIGEELERRTKEKLERLMSGE